jgi:hypothetical protein
MSKRNFLEPPYELSNSTKSAFGKHLINPNIEVPAYEETLIAKYPKEKEGLDVNIYIKSAPAEFFTLKIVRTSIEITTGSGMQDLVAQIAENLANGMLGIESIQKTEKE